MKRNKKVTGIVFVILALIIAILPTDTVTAASDFKINNGVLTSYTGKDANVVIPSGVTKIGANAFSGNIYLKSVEIPETVTVIDKAAFFDCYRLSKITIKGKLKTIGNFAFCGCERLAEISIPDTVTSIGENAFSGCAFKEINLPKGLKTLGDEAFLRCKGLTSIIIPDGLTSLDYCVFEECDNIKSIYIPSSIKSIDVAFPNYKGTLDIYYSGTKEQWNEIKIAEFTRVWDEIVKNTAILKANVHYNMVKIYPFTDIKGDSWYEKYVYDVYEKGAMTGLKETTFGPEVKLDRAMVAMIVYKLEGQPDVDVSEQVFPDVYPGKWYTEAITWAKQNGIVGGYNSGKYGPKDYITRQDFIKMMYSYAQYKGYSVRVPDAESYMEVSDYSTISDYAVTMVNWGYVNGIIGNGSDFKPKNNISRAEAATMISRFLGIEFKLAIDDEPEEPETEADPEEEATTTSPAEEISEETSEEITKEI